MDLDSALSKKAAAERECDQLRAEVHRLEDELQTAISEASEAQKGGNTLSKQSSNNLGDIYDGDLAEETIPSLKEKVENDVWLLLIAAFVSNHIIHSLLVPFYIIGEKVRVRAS